MPLSKKSTISAILTLSCFVFVGVISAATSDNGVQEDESGFFYTIKKGDTLWDLSQKFYGSQWIWPGLWQMNDQIKNPHRIYPGNKIRIYLKGTQPSTLPPIVQTMEKPGPEPVESAPEIVPSFSYPGMDTLGFIRETAVPPLGKIVKSEQDNLMMSLNDIVYIEPMGDNPLASGRTYQIFSTEEIRRIQDDGSIFTGVKHLVKGILKITALKGDYATAEILQSFRDTNIGDSIMSYTSKASIIPVRESLDKIHSRILCSEDNTRFINDNSVAFIDRGSKHGIKPGQLYTVYRECPPVASSTPKQTITINPLETGRLIVLHTEEIASTVLILSSKKDIGPNDLVN